MRIQVIIFILAGIGLLFCKQSNSSKSLVPAGETVNSVRRYVYTDSTGGRLIIANSLPRGNGYTGADGQRHPYVVFYTQLTNHTSSPVDINLNVPVDSLEFPRSSGVYLKLLLPSDTMTAEKATVIDYGLSIKSLLDSPARGLQSVRRTIASNDSTTIYVVLFSKAGVGGVVRTGLRVEGQDLIYKISAYKSVPGHPLLDEEELRLGSIGSPGLKWRKE